VGTLEDITERLASGPARTPGLSTVAEGVETPQQAAELTELAVTHLQGFGLGLPMTGAECTTWSTSRQELLR
jgi:EAL domain-containing protein (putative c-di-GMP-specific phosphodiesterase class I)